MWDQIFQWDKDILICLNSLGSEPYDAFWISVTTIHNWIPLFVFFALLFILKFPKQEAIYKILTVLALALFIILLTASVKELAVRLRPNNNPEINGLIRILMFPADFSFFSGHASSSFAITVLVYLFLKDRFKWAIFFFVWPLLFSSSRIYLGVHYPTDILVGAMAGSLSGILFYKYYVRFIEPC